MKQQIIVITFELAFAEPTTVRQTFSLSLFLPYSSQVNALMEYGPKVIDFVHPCHAKVTT
jgi:hypothetical protein